MITYILYTFYFYKRILPNTIVSTCPGTILPNAIIKFRPTRLISGFQLCRLVLTDGVDVSHAPSFSDVT